MFLHLIVDKITSKAQMSWSANGNVNLISPNLLVVVQEIPSKRHSLYLIENETFEVSYITILSIFPNGSTDKTRSVEARAKIYKFNSSKIEITDTRY